MSEPKFEDEEIVQIEHDEETKCPMCSFRVVRMYRLESEDNAVCGSCFTTWLFSEDATITIE